MSKEPSLFSTTALDIIMDTANRLERAEEIISRMQRQIDWLMAEISSDDLARSQG